MRRLLIALGVLALGAAGCGGNDNNSSTSGGGGGYGTAPATKSSPAPAPAAGTAARTGTIAVTMQNFAFAPNRVDAKVGQTIKWTNADDVAHNVTATSGQHFKSKDFSRGGTYSYKLNKPGTIAYVCTIHPNMTGQIVVTK
jgi:plastocyanin